MLLSQNGAKIVAPCCGECLPPDPKISDYDKLLAGHLCGRIICQPGGCATAAMVIQEGQIGHPVASHCV